MKKPNNIGRKSIIGYSFLILLSILSFIAANFIIDNIKKDAEKSATDEMKEALSQFPDYYAIKGDNPDPKIKVLNVTEDCPPEGCINNKPATVDFDGIKKNYKVTGEFSRAYLYIEALVDNSRPLTSWDDFYFSLNDQGGHLISQENSLPLPASDISRYLYDMGSISYYPTIKDKEKRINKMENIDFFYFLQDKLSLTIWVSVSSNRPGRVTKNVSIYYECLEGSNCYIKEK